MSKEKKIETLHVNLWGIPGVGKTGIAGELFGKLTKEGYLVDLVKEYHKELQLSGLLSRRDERTGAIVEVEQIIISSEQFRRQSQFENIVQVIITDSPVMQGMIFSPAHYRDELTKIMHGLTLGWESMNILLNKDIRKDYNSMGRVQSADDSMALRPEIEALIQQQRCGFMVMDVDGATERIFDYVVSKINNGQFYLPTN